MPLGSGWDVPAEVRGDLEYRWWRVGGNRTLNLVILSEAPFWYRGHFYKGRMIPCAGDNCKLCAEGVGAQLRFVLAAAEISTHSSGLIEIGQTVAREIRDLGVSRGQLRGLCVEFTKHSWHRQSRMEVSKIDREEGPWWRELDVPNVKKALWLCWQKVGIELEGFRIQNDEPSYETRFRRPDRVRS